MPAAILPAGGLTSAPGPDGGFNRFLAVSVILHVLVLAAAGTATLFRSRPAVYRPAYTVDLVSLPPSPRAAQPTPTGPAAPAPSQKPAAKPAAKTAAKPAVSAPPAARKAEVPVKPKDALPVRAGEGDEAARRRADQKKRNAEIERELQKLYESIHKAGEPARPATPAASGPGAPSSGAGAAAPRLLEGAAAGPAGPISAGAGAIDLRMKAYYDRIWEEIKASWTLPSDVASTDQKLVATLVIRIAANGSIEHYWVEKPSGNLYYDQSAIRAIKKADPLPPPPREFAGGTVEVGINFRVTE